MIPVLDATTAALDGSTLVEANAGTGKTYSIVSLYLRLLVEAEMAVDGILVVSFTEAATAELKQRIRERVAALRLAYETGSSDEEFERAMLARCTDRERAARLLTRALQSFDEAAIYTIHGFCQRLLADTGFETGTLAEFEILPDDTLLRRQLIDDFWREQTREGTDAWLAWLAQHSGPTKLATELIDHLAQPLQERLAPDAPRDCGPGEQSFAALEPQLRREWITHREALAALLADDALHKGKYRNALARIVAAADRWAEGSIAVSGNKDLLKLGSATLAQSTNAGRTTPEHPFFDRMQALLDTAADLQQCYESRLALMRRRLLDWADTELPRRKRERGVRAFDDLLNDVHAALQERGAALRNSVRYRAALIDEFQDTDPVQFAIFDQLFATAGKPLFLVGDPKQAIYSFRNADIFAYLQARRHARRSTRLTDNYRSTPELVAAVNELFTRVPRPFMLEEIDYARSHAARDADGLTLDGAPLPALLFWRIGDDEVRATNAARTEIAATTASEIVRMLTLGDTGRLRKGEGPPVQPRDIAVLVRSHGEGDLVRAALADRGVAAVQRTTRNVFGTAEAAELLHVLRAVARPGSAGAVRAALATDLLGHSAAKIAELAGDGRAWQTELDRFAGYAAHWRESGYASMQRRLMRDFGIAERLLGWFRGRRRLTNLLHLEDLLQREAAATHAHPEALLLWMKAQCEDVKRDGSNGNEQALLRLESDENLVRIMTIHFAKGLQFPIVFAPFLFAKVKPPSGPVVAFHGDNDERALDLGTAQLDEHKGRRLEEDRAEQLRLVYVALTRAQLHCVTAWGRIKGTDMSALAWLLHSTAGDDHNSVAQRLRRASQAELFEPLTNLADELVSVMPLPEAHEQRYETASVATTLRPRKPVRQPGAGWRVSSFSAIARAQPEQPRDYDALPTAAAEPAVGDAIFGFPRGARAGRAMHTLFERIDFAADAQAFLPVAAAVLHEHGYEQAQAPVLAQMAGDVLATPLNSDDTFRLRDVDGPQRVSEMEFYFPMTAVDAAAVREALGAYGAGGPIAQRLTSLEFRLTNGFMRGFIDLVAEYEGRYYVLDYKSNWMGPTLEDYRADRLSAEIARHDYHLQYLLYAVALQRHLRSVLADYDYDTHMGGVRYLFLRGMRPARGARYGVYTDRPSADLIARLEAALCVEPLP